MSRIAAIVPPFMPDQSDVHVPKRRITLRSGANTFVADIARIERLEAAGIYVRVHEAARSFLVRGTLTTLMNRLGQTRFARVHRSYAVALDAIVELRRTRGGELRVVMADGTVLPATLMTREELERLLES